MCEVDPASGAVCLEEQDFSLHGDMAFFFTRRYNNRSDYTGRLGRGWIHPFDSELTLRGGRLALLDEEGRTVPLENPKPDQSVRCASEGFVLERNSAGYRIHRAGGKSLTYAPAPGDGDRFVLTRLDQTDQNTLWFLYAGGLLSEIHTTSGHVLLFAYNSSRLIESILLHIAAGERAPLVTYAYDRNRQLARAYDRQQIPLAYEYSGGLLTRATNRLGGSYYLQYDNERRCVAVWQDGHSRLRTYRYDTVKRATLVTNALGESTIYRFNENNLLVETVRSDGSVAERVYANGNQPLAIVGGPEPAPVVKHDDLQNAVEETEPDGGVSESKYDSRGRLVEQVDPLGGVERWEYNDANQIARHTDAFGGIWSFEFDERRRLAAQVTPLGNRVRAVRAAEGATVLEDSLGPLCSFRQDAFGNTTTVARASGQTTSFRHDPVGRLVALTLADGATAERQYDAEGYLVRRRDLAGNETRYDRDPFGLVLKWLQPHGRAITYEYDSERRLIAARSSTGVECRFAYDSRSRVIEETLRDGRRQTFVYGEHGRRSSVLRSGGVETHYAYNAAGLVTSIRSGDSEASFDYDPAGNCTAARTAGHLARRKFGPGDLLIAEDQDGFQVEYEYNAAGLPARRKDSTGRVAKYSYDLRGQLTEVEDSAFGAWRFEYDRFGRKSAQISPNGIRREYSYNGRDEVSRVVTADAGGAALTDRHYSYTPTGELAQAGGAAFQYDAGYHLLRMSGNGEPEESFEYDLDENVVSSSRLGVFEAQGLLLRSAGPLRYEYDGAGRVSSRFEAASKLTLLYGLGGLIREAVLADGRTYSYEYDGFGRRVVKRGPKGTVRYYWDRDNLLAEVRTGPAGSVRIEYAVLPGSFRPLGHSTAGAAFYYDLDQRSLIREVYDRSGRAAARFRYRAFGERLADGPVPPEADPPFRLLGQYADFETGLHYNRFRYYDPAVGRFLSPDLYVHEVHHNPYAYAPNPIGWADPYGLMPSFSQGLKDTLKEENKEENGGFYECAHCGFKHKEKIFARTSETGKPVGDGSFHADHKDTPNCDGGEATRENAQVLGGTCNCSKGKRKQPGMT